MVKDKGTYMLEELDGSRLADTFAGDRVKKFYLCQRLKLDHTPNLDNEEIPTLDDFLADSDSELSDAPNDLSAFRQFPDLPLMHLSSWLKFANMVISFLLLSLFFGICFLGVMGRHLSGRGRM